MWIAVVPMLIVAAGCGKPFRPAPVDQSLSFSSLVGGPPVSEKQVTEDTELSFNLVLRPSGRVTFRIVTQPGFGTVKSFDAATGFITYAPNPNVSGIADRIEYKIIIDGDESLTPELYVVRLNIQPVNDLPVTQDITAQAFNEDTPAVINATAADVDNDPLTFAVVTGPANGTVTYDAVNSRWQYTPKANFNGADSFTFKALDGTGESNLSTVRLQVTPVNDAPMAVTPPATALNEDTSAQIVPSATDVDGDALTFEVVAAPASGTLAYNAAAARWTYTPRANINGADSFTFRARDPAGAMSATVTATITVNPVNDAPTMSPQSFGVQAGKSLSGTVTGSDVDNDALTFAVAATTQRGSLNFNANGSFTYQPAQGTVGEDSFQVYASDGSANSAAVKITINVGENVDDAFLVKNLVSDCATNPLYNACIFWKNPVAQTGAPFPAPITATTNLSGHQIHGVSIPRHWYDTSGFFRNSTFDVYFDTVANTAARVPTASGNFKYTYAGDANRRTGQVLTFYWLMVQMKYMKQRLGSFFAESTGIRVFTSDPSPDAGDNAYYDPSTNEVHLGRDGDLGTDMGLGAEVTLHEMGHANAEHATQGAIGINDGISTKLCRVTSTSPWNVCCKTKDGCSWAAGEGLADHHVAILFFNTPALGETYMNRLDGLSTCGVPRNSLKNANLTADGVYGACGAIGAPGVNGEVHAVGSLYASIWYELKKAAREAGGADAIDIDKLFNEHLKVITGEDTFVTLYDKIRAIDTALFGGRFGSRVQAEFQRRGII